MFIERPGLACNRMASTKRLQPEFYTPNRTAQETDTF